MNEDPRKRLRIQDALKEIEEYKNGFDIVRNRNPVT